MRVSCLLLAVLLPHLAAAQGEKKHPIDQTLTAAIEKDSSTAGQMRAISAAHKKWDVELNRAYKKLLKHLDAKAAGALRESQRAWMTWRDKEIANLFAFYGKMQGTMWGPINSYSEMELTRQRAIDLGDMAEFVEDREIE